MKKLLMALTAFAFATSALAQTTTTTTTTAPVSQAPAQQPDLVQKQLQEILAKKKDNKEFMGQAMVAGIMLGCIKKEVGTEATNAFYQDLQATGQAAEAYCKARNSAKAREVVVNKIEQKRNDPVTKAALGCYDQQNTAIVAMGGPKLAANMAHYVTWLRTPGSAAQEIKENDICKEQKVANQ